MKRWGNRQEQRRLPTAPGGRFANDIVLLTLGAFLYTIASPPYEWAGAGWFALAPLFLVLRNNTPRRALLAGLLYGVLSCFGIASWVYFAVTTYFPLTFPFDLLSTLASYTFFVGSYMGIASALSCVLMRRGGPLLCSGGIPALWVSGEFARSSLFSGFSWGLLGYSQYQYLHLIQISDITGVYGLSFLMALSSYAVAETLVFLRQRRNPTQWQGGLPWSAVGALAVGLMLVLLYSQFRLSSDYAPSPAPVTVALVQGNMPSEHRWQPAHYGRTLRTYSTITRRTAGNTQPDLVVWPEFALGFYLDREYLLRAQLAQLADALDVFLLVGAPRLEESDGGRRYYNSAHFVSPDGQLRGTYDKIRLLPFAEYRPFSLPGLRPHSHEIPTDFTPGRQATVFSLPKGTFGTMICYEATYPDLARRLVRNGAQFLVNISNDTWLAGGGNAAAAQHFAMTVFRAVENRRPLVRLATSGISGFVDPMGRPHHVSTLKEGAILAEVLPRREMSPYTRYGDWFAWGCVSASLIAPMKARSRPIGARQRS